MPIEIILPQWGMGMNDGQVVRWLKKVGDEVKKGDQLVEIESSKVNSEVEATGDGTLARILVEEGTIAPVGARLGVILAPGETEADLPAEDDKPAAEEDSPAASGSPASGGGSSQGGRSDGKRPVATPRARSLAKRLGVDLEQVTGTGPSGRITEDDVQKAADGGDSGSAGAAPAPSTVPVRETIKLSGMRSTIARRMTESAQAPTVTLNTHADVTAAIEVQRKLVGEWRSEKIRPQYQDLLVAALAKGLREVPRANAHFVSDEIRLLDEVNIGVAMAVPDGLLVPVIHGADKKSPLELAKEIRELAKLAKDGSLKSEHLTGGTFSLTNLGSYDVESFDPLLNPPEIGILGVGRVEERPAVVDGEIVVRSIGHLSLTFDHRAWDGAPAADFLKTVVGHLKSPEWLLS